MAGKEYIPGKNGRMERFGTWLIGCGAGAPVMFGLMAAAATFAVSGLFAGLFHLGQWIHGRKGPVAGGSMAHNSSKTTGDVDIVDSYHVVEENEANQPLLGEDPQEVATDTDDSDNANGSAAALAGLGGVVPEDPNAALKPATPPPPAPPEVEAEAEAEAEAEEKAGFEI